MGTEGYYGVANQTERQKSFITAIDRARSVFPKLWRWRLRLLGTFIEGGILTIKCIHSIYNPDESRSGEAPPQVVLPVAFHLVKKSTSVPPCNRGHLESHGLVCRLITDDDSRRTDLLTCATPAVAEIVESRPADGLMRAGGSVLPRSKSGVSNAIR